MDLTLMHPLKLHNLWYTLFTENFTFTVSGSSLSQTSEAVCHIFANLNKHNRLYLIFDPTDPVPAIHILNKPDESDFDGEVVEQRPQNVPALVINAFIIFVFRFKKVSLSTGIQYQLIRNRTFVFYIGLRL